MRRVYGSFDLPAVHHARNLLESEGIACIVRNEILSSAMGELPPAECQIEVWVLHDGDAARADQLIRLGSQPPAGITAWQCTACGESAEAQFSQCWNCGAQHP